MTKRKILSLLLAASTMLAVGCDKCSEDIVVNGEVNAKVWSTNALEKVQRDIEYNVETPAKLSIELAKNEIEGGQFIVTNLGDYQVQEFTVKMSSLKNANGAEIPADAVKVYLQKYLNVTHKMNADPSVSAGYVPDAILPFEKAVEYGENKVEGTNQGVYVTVETQTDTAAGTYLGNCLVTVDGKEFNVPVEVTVWDFAISEEVHTATLFDLWQDHNMMGELDSTMEMYEKYYEYLAQNRISADLLPGEYDTPEEYAQMAKRAYEDVRITAFRLPYRGGKQNLDTAFMKEYVMALIQASETDAELLNKATYYVGALDDEPQFNDTLDDAHIYTKQLDAMEEDIISELEQVGYFADKDAATAESIKEKIRKIPHIVTVSYQIVETDERVTEAWEYGEVTFCPLFDSFSGSDFVPGKTNVEMYQDIREANGQIWWYGCNGPLYPWPSYHLDGSLVGARVIGTMMYDYGIDGNLYWCVNFYQQNHVDDGDIRKAADPYDDAFRDGTGGVNVPHNGEGFLLYPGADYGIDGPVGSLRVEAIRDGNEDYEYYYLLDQLTEGLSDYYGMDISVENMVSNLYDRLYSDVKYIPDADNFSQVRRELAEIITTCSSDSKYVFNGLKYAGSTASIEFLAASDYAVKVNGENVTGTAQGSGMKYTALTTLDKSSNEFVIELTKGNTTISFKVVAGGKMATISSFDDASSLSLFTVNDASVVLSHNTDGAFATSGGSLKALITSKFNPDSPKDTLLYNPRISLDVKANGVDMVNLDTLVCNMYNASGTPIDLRVKFETKQGYYLAHSMTLQEGWNTVKLTGIYTNAWMKLSQVEKVVFEFNNSVGNAHEAAMPVQVVYFDELIFSEVAH